MSSLPGRRDILKAAALAGAGLATAAPNAAPKLLHVGLVGAGGARHGPAR